MVLLTTSYYCLTTRGQLHDDADPGVYCDHLLLISPLTPMRRAYHTQGRPIAIAPSENGVDKHKGRDNICVAAKQHRHFSMRQQV